MFYKLVTRTSKYPSSILELQSFATQEDIDRAEKFLPSNNAITIRPNSVFVGAIGNHWSPGSWQKVVDMVHYTNEHGSCCWLVEFPDMCVTLPYDAIGGLRDHACLAALDAGFEWVLLIDNDVMPEPDMLLKLTDWGMPVVVPLMIDHERDFLLSDPKYNLNSGLRRIKWSALSCILICTKVLNCFPPGTLFTNLMVEFEFFNKISHYGHRCFVDTNTELALAQNPSYSGGLDSLSERAAFMDKADRRRKENPDRKPIDPTDTREIYLPNVLIVPPKEKDGDNKGIAKTEDSQLPQDSTSPQE